MKKITPAFILGTISIIFGYDTIAEIFGSHATISEWAFTQLHTDIYAPVVFWVAVTAFFAHFWFFRPNKDAPKNKGGTPMSTVVTVALVTSFVTGIGTYIANNVLAAPAQSQAAVGALQTDVAVLKSKEIVQDTEIDTLTKSADTTNKNVVKLLIKFGIQPVQ